MIGIPMGTNCAPLLADLFLYSYENEFLDKLIKEGKRKLARRFNLSYCYIDDLISFNNKRFKEFISNIYPKELTISETTESTSVASYLDLLFTRDRNNNITTKLYDKRDAFGFQIVNFPFMSSNIPSAPAYGVYVSQLIRYARCCSSYSDFLIRHRAVVKRLLSQGYKVNHAFVITYWTMFHTKTSLFDPIYLSMLVRMTCFFNNLLDNVSNQNILI